MKNIKKELEIQIRIAAANDAFSIETLMLEAFSEFNSVYTKEAFDATAIKSAEILERMNEGPLWVAILNGKIIGTVSAVHKESSLYIRGMAVHTEERGRRVGEMLLIEAEKYAAANNCSRLFLGTTRYLESAIRLYERMGYRRLEELEDFFEMPLIIMEKFLNKEKFRIKERDRGRML